MTIHLEVSEALATIRTESAPMLLVRSVEDAAEDMDYVLTDVEGDIMAGLYVNMEQDHESTLGVITDKGWENLTKSEKTAVKVFARAAIGFAAENTHGDLFSGIRYDQESDVPVTEVFKFQRVNNDTSRVFGRAIREAIPQGFIKDAA